MKLFPAIDIIDGKAVRLVRGDYSRMTVYSDSPFEVAKNFSSSGAEYLHVVDLEGAKTGGTPNFYTISEIIRQSGMKVEIGGGIRREDDIERYIYLGAHKVILGTVSVTDPKFTEEMVKRYGDKIAVGVDIKDGFVAIKGWTELSRDTCFDFCQKMCDIGVKSVICTDISKDGLLSGTNIELYRELASKFDINITASGGITSLEDIIKLRELGLYGAVLGKALYTGNIDLAEAVKACKGADE